MSVKETLEEIRRKENWPVDDVIFVIHTDKEGAPLVEKVLQNLGITGVELVPEKKRTI